MSAIAVLTRTCFSVASRRAHPLGWGLSAPSSFIREPHHKFVLSRERDAVGKQSHGRLRHAALRQLHHHEREPPMLYLEDARGERFRRFALTNRHRRPVDARL